MSDNVRPLRPYPLPAVASEPWGGFLASEILDRPKPREWIVDAMVPRKTVVLLAGAPKVGKSLLLQQMLTSVSQGVPWIGCHTEQVKALGIFLEDDRDELSRRQWDIAASDHQKPEDLGEWLELNPREHVATKLFTFPRGNDVPQLTPFGQKLWRIVDEAGYQLIGLDPAILLFGGRTIIDPEKIANCLRELTKLAADHNAAIVISAHTNRADPSSFAGPNAWLGTVRAAMNMRIAMDDMMREPIRGQRILSDLGGNYGSWDRITLIWREGVWITAEPEPPRRPKTTNERTELNYRLLTYLGKVVSRGALVSLDDTDDHSLVRRVRRQQKIAYNDVSAAQEWMLEQGLAVLVKVGGRCFIRPRDARYEGEEPWR
jgi:hypothetical protein